MFNNQYVIWLFVGISSVLVSQTTSQSWTTVRCSHPNTACPSNSFCQWQWINFRYYRYCLCKRGYTWRRGQCRDWDECTGSNLCDQNALWICINTPGSYSCACKLGYEWDGHTCIDIDECSDSSPCSEFAVCENYPGGYNCTCLTGYSGNGTICTDLDECSNSSPCDKAAACQNYPGGYNCTCLSGYSGNGTLCIDTQVTGLAALAASPGAIAGGVLGACALLVVVVVLVLFLTRRRRNENSDVDVPESPPQPMYENVRMSSGVSTAGKTAAVVSPDVDGSHAELYHNNLIKERKKIQLNQRTEKSDNKLDINTTTDITYSGDNIGECGGSHYDKLFETKIEQPSPNFTKERFNGDVQLKVTTEVQISNGDELYRYDLLKRGVSQPDDNAGHDQEGEAYGHLYGAGIDNWDTENTDIDDELSKTNNVYSLAKDVDRD